MKQLSSLLILAFAVFLTACSPAPEPEPVDDIKTFGDALQELNEILDDSPALGFGGDCEELDEYEEIVGDYILVLEAYAENGEQDAELVAKKLDLEERAEAMGEHWGANEQISPGCALRLVEIQMKFSVAAMNVFGTEFEDALNSGEFQEAIEEIEEAAAEMEAVEAN